VRNITVASGYIIQAVVVIKYIVIDKYLILEGLNLAGIGLFTKFDYKATVDCKYRSMELE